MRQREEIWWEVLGTAVTLYKTHVLARTHTDAATLAWERPVCEMGNPRLVWTMRATEVDMEIAGARPLRANEK